MTIVSSVTSATNANIEALAREEAAKAQPQTTTTSTTQNGGIVGALLGNVFGALGTVTSGVAQVVGSLRPAIQSGQAQYGQQVQYYYQQAQGPSIFNCGDSPAALSYFLDCMQLSLPGMVPGTMPVMASAMMAANSTAGMTEAQALRQALGSMGFGGQVASNAQAVPPATSGYSDTIAKLTPDQLKQLKGIEEKIKDLAQKENKTDAQKAEMKNLISQLKSLEKEFYGIESDEELPSEIIKNKDGKSYIYSNLHEDELEQIKSNKTNLQSKIDELNKKQESLAKLGEKIRSYTSQGQNPPGITQAAYNTVNADMAKLQKEISELAAKNEEYIPSAFKDDKTAEYKAASTGSSTGSNYDLGEKKPEKDPEPGKNPVAEKTPATPAKPSVETREAIKNMIKPEGSTPAAQETPQVDDKPKPNPEIQAIVDKGGEDYTAIADKISKLDMKDKNTQSYEQARYLLLAAVESSDLKDKKGFIDRLKSSDYDGLPDIFAQLLQNGIGVDKLGAASKILLKTMGG